MGGHVARGIQHHLATARKKSRNITSCHPPFRRIGGWRRRRDFYYYSLRASLSNGRSKGVSSGLRGLAQGFRSWKNRQRRRCWCVKSGRFLAWRDWIRSVPSHRNPLKPQHRHENNFRHVRGRCCNRHFFRRFCNKTLHVHGRSCNRRSFRRSKKCCNRSSFRRLKRKEKTTKRATITGSTTYMMKAAVVAGVRGVSDLQCNRQGAVRHAWSMVLRVYSFYCTVSLNS